MADEFFEVKDEFFAPGAEFETSSGELFKGASSEYFDHAAAGSFSENDKHGGRVHFRRMMLYASCSLVLTVAVTTAVTGGGLWGGSSSDDSGYDYEYEYEHEHEHEHEFDDYEYDNYEDYYKDLI
ncbi:MAG: hypothetical protein J6U10_08860 [Lachnospiraceae bacterium]|nr:hypothetical protein [Lachnospiraceae bacterium]